MSKEATDVRAHPRGGVDGGPGKPRGSVGAVRGPAAIMRQPSQKGVERSDVRTGVKEGRQRVHGADLQHGMVRALSEMSVAGGMLLTVTGISREMASLRSVPVWGTFENSRSSSHDRRVAAVGRLKVHSDDEPHIRNQR